MKETIKIIEEKILALEELTKNPTSVTGYHVGKLDAFRTVLALLNQEANKNG